jgi:nucleoside 2-deoxyribosyltransferase
MLKNKISSRYFMGMEKLVYLAGPITGLDYNGCTDWREYAKKELAKWGITGLSPMRAKEYLASEKNISDEYSATLSSSKGIVTRDRFDVMSCNVMLSNLLGAKKISIGTVIECGWADAFRKPIITVIEKEGNPHEHAMIRELTGFRVEDLDKGLYIARAILNS